MQVLATPGKTRAFPLTPVRMASGADIFGKEKGREELNGQGKTRNGEG